MSEQINDMSIETLRRKLAAAKQGEVPLIPKIAVILATMNELSEKAERVLGDAALLDLSTYEAAFTMACIHWMLSLGYSVQFTVTYFGDVAILLVKNNVAESPIRGVDEHEAVVRATWQVAQDLGE